MSNNSPGIKSISSRLDQLEASSNQFTYEPSFVNEIHRKQNENNRKKVLEKYQDIKKNYVQEINKWISNPLNQFTKLVELTIYYVEKTAPIVSTIFNIVVKGDSKLSFAVELISLVSDAIINMLGSEFIKNSINHFVTIFNERNLLTSKANAPFVKPKKKKKGFFSRTVKSIQSISLR